MHRPIIVSPAAIGLPVAAGPLLAQKRGNGRFKSHSQPNRARPLGQMSVLLAEVRVS